MSHLNGRLRGVFFAAIAGTCLALSGCQTSAPISAISIDRTQGSEENIDSLTAVIRNNPSDPEPYNVRGAVHCRCFLSFDLLVGVDMRRGGPPDHSPRLPCRRPEVCCWV